MRVYLAFSRVQYEGDQLIGVFSTQDNAEFGIINYLRNIKEMRQITDDDELLFSLAAEFCVDIYETDGTKDEANCYTMTSRLIKDLLNY